MKSNNIEYFKIKNLLFGFAIFLIGAQFTFAQLSDLHYLPPLKMSQNTEIFTSQAIYISTPETTAFDIEIYQGTNTTPIATVSVSNSVPYIYSLANNNNDVTMVSEENTGIVLQNSGLKLQAVGGQEFYVSFRGSSNAQGESLTSKGRTALGTNFKWGSIPTVDTSSNNSNHNVTMGIMATEDNTTVVISDYDPDCTFRQGTDIDGITDDSITILLNANETYVLEASMSGNPNNRFGTIGASIVSDKDIAISNGNLMVGLIQGANQQDAGMDQSVPIEKLGREYVFMRGNGRDALEFPVIIATENSTRVFVNDATTSIATLNEGEYITIDGSNYSGSTAGENMYVRTSKNVYAYQLTAGDDAYPNLGMNFISPVNCLMPQIVDNIANINQLPSTTVTGGITLLASTTTLDANIVVNDNSGVVTLPTSKTVSGSTDWKTFYVPNLTGNVKIESSGPISVGYIGFNGAIGTASYFSGFDNVPSVGIVENTDEICLGSTITLESSFDSYQWYQNDEIVDGATSQSFTPTAIGEVYVEVTSGGCAFNSNSYSIYYCDPEVVINKTVDQEQVDVGDTVTFTINVQSLGLEDVTNLVIEDTLPDGLTFVSATPSTGTWNNPNWEIGTMSAGEIQTITIIATVDGVSVNSESNTIINTAYNTQDQTDNNIESDSPSASITVGNDTDNDGIDNDIDLDDDNDGILDADETTADDDGDGIINSIDLDSDNDGISDIIEAGGTDTNGDGRVDYPTEGDPSTMIDTNNNGVDDTVETDPYSDPDSDGDGVKDRLDVDSDNDGITDTREAGGIDTDNDGTIDDIVDTNNNGLSDDVETNPLENPDSDGDGVNDSLDLDSDNDGITDIIEAGGVDNDANGMVDSFTDTDLNGISDDIETNPLENPDTDGDGVNDNLDLDSDNDGITDAIESEETDTDSNGIKDNFYDSNSNGFSDDLEGNSNENIDSDLDGIINRLDSDSDNDGITDTTEAGGNDENGDGYIDSFIDSNNNGLSDDLETEPLLIPNTDENDEPNYLDKDSDDDGIPDNIEAQPTEGYIAPTGVSALNGFDTAYSNGQTPQDTDEDGTPDYLDTDSDNDDIDDTIEASVGEFIGSDSDGDGIDDGFEGDNLNDPEDANDEIDDPTTLPDLQNPGGDVDYRDNEVSEPIVIDDDCDPETGLLSDNSICDVVIDNESVGPQIDEGYFRIKNIEAFPDNTLKVFNRWGVLVSSINTYTNGSNDFRGISTARATISQQELLPSGVYFYILDYVSNGENKTKSGYLYIVR
ncbi:gliding motility-associated C-terminal domain-containing protein [Cellulophaga baltica]|uniref:T9SS type B sorting domain-containing protein n=1 Tax=Cellulophaga TaxID=104264 RepID=UPI001C06EBAF|nr:MULTISPECIES: gliding motility-associated C-terminal domain-containing protein [Cellulophaga]MBU2997755.1 gliding motility-associated C-terminal domain-containing protein [Cellulophaga baltica]MDO6769151.1 gliding motility-associated C-terminal domain-containing protein [Cellulophaga sp. 1_MG-2023]